MLDRLRSPVVVDALLAAGLTGWNQWELAARAEFTEGAVTLNHLAFAVMTVAVGLRRVAPLACAIAGAAGLATQTVWGGDVYGTSAQFVALLVIMHAAGSHPDLRRSVAGLVVMMAAVECYPFVSDEPFELADEVGNVAVFLAVWGLARAVQVGRRRQDALAVEAERRERDAVEAERARVARELHDIVAHGLSLMVLHAAAARSAADADAAARSLGIVEDSGRAAMTELHRLLGMLAGPADSEPDGMAGLANLPELADQMRRAGMTVELEVVEPAGALDRSVELSAYRIVQEGLTNALRHGGDGPVRVRVAAEAGGLGICVANRVGPGRGAAVAGSGRGLRGLAERTAVFGGQFRAGPTPDGWEIRATLPTEARR